MSERESSTPPAEKHASDALRGWINLALAALSVIVLTVPIFAIKEWITRGERGALRDTALDVTFVGRQACIGCHDEACEKWSGSDHDLAMDVASDSTVLGDFNNATFEHGGVTSRFYKRNGRYYVYTEGPGGEIGEFEITHTFGVDPLQQYLIPLTGGRLQALTTAWDTVRKRWFYLYPNQDIPPDDWLHWTRAGQNWNGMCAECHSTNLVKGYDPSTRQFHTTWSEIDVSCEACHGPASRHVEWARIQPMARPEIENYGLVVATSGITNEAQVELCAPCHSRRTQFGDYDHTQSGPLENLVPAVLTEALYYADGQIKEEVYVYGSFLQSKMFANDVRCTDCHDAHSLQLKEDGNALCLQCHQADAYDTYDHHFHKKIHEGKPSDGALCVKCHMPERPYMVIDWRADHSIRVPRPDLARDIGSPSSCERGGCHADKSLDWLIDHFTDWYGRARKSHYGRTIYAGRKGNPEALEALVRLAGDELYPGIVRATALELLRSYPGEESTRAFNMALADPDALVRYTAVQNVNVSQPEELIQLVAPLLFDPSRVIRGQVATRLTAVRNDALKPYQRAALQTAITEYRRTQSGQSLREPRKTRLGGGVLQDGSRYR
jgi:predicted CXXCH cytochrome family protein